MGSLADFNFYIASDYVLIIAGFIIVLLSCMEKRKSYKDVCYGHPALLIPFRFLDGYESRIAYAMAFGTTTNTIVSLITSKPILVIDYPLTIQALYVYFQAMVGCLTCFPLFACLTTRYRVLGAVLCILYSLLWLILNSVQMVQDVQENANSTLFGIEISSSDKITVNVALAYQVLKGLPITSCYIVLIVYSSVILYRCYLSKTYITERMECSIRPHQEQHVQWVLRKVNMKRSVTSTASQDSASSTDHQSLVNQMKNSIQIRYFKNIPFFKYPTRIIALAFVQLNVLYWIGLLLVMGTTTVMYLMINAEFTQKYISQYDLDLLIIICVCSSVSIAVCIGNSLVQIFIGFRNYRFDMLRIYQGNRTFIPVLNETSQHILTRSMTFPGFQVAFMMWGVVISFVTVLLLTLIPILLLYFFAKFSILDDITLKVLQVLSFPASVFILFYLQVFVTKAVLLQKKVKATDKSPPLNVDNRKLYELMNYYALFTNMAVGILSCLWRIAESAVIGIFSVGRLDRSVFTRDNENIDNGYTAYVSWLLVDNAHNNPCMRVFAHLLWTKTLAARLREVQSLEELSEHTALTSEFNQRYTSIGTVSQVPLSPTLSIERNPWTFCEINGNSMARKSVIRWHLAYTLINNPQLCILRKQMLSKKYCRTTLLACEGEEKDIFV